MNNAELQSGSCERTELLIDDYLEGMISIQDKEIIDAHIATCESCAKYLNETQKTILDLSTLNADNYSMSASKKTELWKNVDSKIDDKKYLNEKSDDSKTNRSASQKPDFFSKYKYYISGIAAILLIAVIYYGVKNTGIKGDRLSEQSAFGLETYWKVSNLQGTPTISGAAMTSLDSIREGQFIQTNADSRAELLIASIGKIIIEPNSKIVFVKDDDGNKRILVEYGTINANMIADPKTFFVEMPSAVASDLGGSYTLTIDSTGDGLVYVKSGKVEVQSNDRAAIVPAGNLVMTRKDFGVGTPFNENSSPQFKNALFNFDFGNCGGTCVNTLINSAKMSDAVTLVNILPVVENQYRDQVYAKVANYVAPPVPPATGDSIPYFSPEEINEWVDKIQQQVQLSIEQNLKAVEENLEHMKVIEKLNIDSLKGLEKLAKDWNFKVKTKTGEPYNYDYDYEYDLQFDTTGFNREELKRELEEAQKEFKKAQEENKVMLKEDMEDLKKDLMEMQKELKEDLDMNNEQIKQEMERAKEEIKKALKEVEKINADSVYKNRVKVRVNENLPDTETNTETEHPVETPEALEPPSGGE